MRRSCTSDDLLRIVYDVTNATMTVLQSKIHEEFSFEFLEEEHRSKN